ncbi:MAG: hypothetical protein J6M20_09895 [Clostridia bacterium]|nr:hypothetical protein [Clostridia bacterium]
MRTERNEFQQLVDHQLANVQWDRRLSNAVFRKLNEEKQPCIPRSTLRYGLAFAVVLLTVGLVSLSLLHRPALPDTVVAAQPGTIATAIDLPSDSRAEAVHLARQAVMEKYGLTLQTLGVFRDDCRLTDSGWVVRFYTNGQISPRLAGEYTVEKEHGFITASWTHDDVDLALLADGSLEHEAWGQPQLLYARTTGSREAWSITEKTNAEDDVKVDYYYIEGTELWGDPLTDVEPAPGDLPAESLTDAAHSALARQFGLTHEQLITIMGGELNPQYAALRQSDAGIRVRVFSATLTMDGANYYVAVCINTQTGKLERLEYTTLGNG